MSCFKLSSLGFVLLILFPVKLGRSCLLKLRRNSLEVRPVDSFGLLPPARPVTLDDAASLLHPAG